MFNFSINASSLPSGIDVNDHDQATMTILDNDSKIHNITMHDILLKANFVQEFLHIQEI